MHLRCASYTVPAADNRLLMGFHPAAMGTGDLGFGASPPFTWGIASILLGIASIKGQAVIYLTTGSETSLQPLYLSGMQSSPS